MEGIIMERAVWGRTSSVAAWLSTHLIKYPLEHLPRVGSIFMRNLISLLEVDTQ